MTLQQLRYLIAVSEQGSINAAAQSLYVSQSNLSTAIKELERELGIVIFTRTNRGVTLTNDGTELLGYARQVVEQADMLESRYAHTREECEEKLKTLIVEMKAEIAEARRLKDLGEGDGRPLEEKKGKRAGVVHCKCSRKFPKNLLN